MQHTNKYQFNLVESGDTFSPTPLNENMEKVEAALSAQAAAIGTGGSTCRIACGSYVGDGTGPKTLTFDFMPQLVMLNAADSSFGTAGSLLLRGLSGSVGGLDETVPNVVWGENSISFGKNGDTYNCDGRTVYYAALGS